MERALAPPGKFCPWLKTVLQDFLDQAGGWARCMVNLQGGDPCPASVFGECTGVVLFHEIIEDRLVCDQCGFFWPRTEADLPEDNKLVY
eukprot:g28907.t1